MWWKNGKSNPDLIHADGSIPWEADQPLGGFNFTGARAAVASGELVRYDEFVAALFGLKYKGTVKAATTGNETLSGPKTIDGIGCIAGDLVGVVAQTNKVENGIYEVAAGAWTRTSNFAAGMAAAGAYFQAEQGTDNGERFFVCVSDSGSDVIGTDNLDWSSWGAITHHQSLADLQGGGATERYHLTAAQHTTLTGTLTASQVVETTAGNVLTSAAKNTAYNVNFGDAAGTALVGNSGRVPTGNALGADGAAVLAATLTAGSVVFADGATKLADDAALTWDNTGKQLRLADGAPLALGGSQDALLFYSSVQTPDALMLGLGADSRGFIICEEADINTDFGHAIETNPTVFFHSADATDTTQWGSLAHDGTDFVFKTGKGSIRFDSNISAGTVGCARINSTESLYLTNDNQGVVFGAGTDALIWYTSNQTPHSLMITTPATSNALLLCEFADRTTDFANPLQTDPTLIFQSSDATKIYQGTRFNWAGITGKTIGAVAVNGADFTITAQAGGTSGDRDGGKLVLWGGAKGNAGADGYVSVGTPASTFGCDKDSLFVAGIIELTGTSIAAPNLQSGANQGAAGAAAGEFWHDTTDDTIKMGV